MTDQSSYLDSVPVKFDKERFSFHDIQRDIIDGISSFKDGFKVVYFYQNPSYDSILPTALELLYQATDKLGEGKNRKKVLVYGGTEHGKLTEAYEKMYFGSALYCNELFGYGKLNSSGEISGEKKTYQKGKRVKKNADDNLIFSHTYKSFPSEAIAKDINSIIIKPPSKLQYWVSEINNRAEEHDIPNIVVFDPHPSANKIRYYQGLGFQIYGWNHQEMRNVVENSKNEELPISETSGMELFSAERNYNVELVRDSKISKRYKKLKNALKQARTHDDTHLYGRTKLNKIVKLSRKLSSLSAPLTEFDKEYLHSPLSRNIDNFEKRLQEDIGEGATAEVFESAHLLREIKDLIQDENPKFNSLAKIVASKVDAGERTLVLMPSNNEIRAFKRALRNMSNPLNLEESQVEFASFKTDLDFFKNSNFDSVVLSTYPFLKNGYLVSDALSENTTVLMYPWEQKDYEYFQRLYRSIEDKFFSESHRKDVKENLIEGEVAENLEVPSVRREEFVPQTDVDVEEESESLQTLIRAERSMDVSQESFIGNTETEVDAAEGEVEEAIKMSLDSDRDLFVRPQRDLQVLEASDSVKTKNAVDVKIGDTLILVESSAAMNLNELIRNKAENIPELRVYDEMARLWKEELQREVEKEDDSVDEVLEKLQEQDSSITSTATVKTWIRGDVIGPRDFQDIVRIGEAYDIEDLQENAEQIARAVRKVRRIRSTVIRRAKDALVTDDEEMVEELEDELNIDIDEFTNALEFERVVDVKNVKDVSKKNLNTAGEKFEVKVT